MKIKTAKFFPMMIASAALLRGICHAKPVSNGGQNTPPSVGHDVRSAGERAQVAPPAQNLYNPLAPPQNKGGGVKNPSANVPATGQLFSAPPRMPAKPLPGGIHSLTIRPSIIQPAGPLLTKAPDHGSTQAVVGGPVTPKIKSTATAAVTGTGLNHKP